LKFVYIILLLTTLLSSAEPKEIIVATESWKGATNRDGTGLYWDVVQEVYGSLGYKIIKKHKSYNQATEMVRTNKADMYLASYKDEKSFALCPKYYFDQDVILAVYRNDVIEDWQGQKSLEGLNVGWVRGYDLDKYLIPEVNVKEFSSRENGLKLLKSERLDAFLDEREDIQPYLEKVKLDTEAFSKKIVLQLKLYPAFTNNTRGKKLMKIWDERMKALIQTEKFKEIYYRSEYAIFPY